MREAITTTNAPQPVGPFSQGIVAGNLVLVSAQLAMNRATGKMVMDTIEEETAQVMDNIRAILREAALDFDDVVKVSIFLKDMRDYAAVNTVYAAYFTPPFPARETIEVAGLPLYVNIEIAVMAIKK